MKRLLTLFTLLLCIGSLAACSNETSKQDNNSKKLSPSGQELNFGILPAEAAIPIILAKEKNFFNDLGVNVSIKAFTSPNDRNVAVQAKELDGTIGDVMTAAVFVDRGLPMKITSDIREDFKILSSPNSGITSMEQLKDKSVSLVPNFILEYIMDEFASASDFSYNIVEIPSFSGRIEALMADQIDGVVFTEPQAGMLVAMGAHLLGSSKDADINGGAFLFTEDTILNRPGDIKAFYEGYNQAIDYMNSTDVSEYSDILAKYQFPEAISGYLSAQQNDFKHASTISLERFNDIIEWTKSKEQIAKIYTYEEICDFSFLN